MDCVARKRMQKTTSNYLKWFPRYCDLNFKSYLINIHEFIYDIIVELKICYQYKQWIMWKQLKHWKLWRNIFKFKILFTHRMLHYGLKSMVSREATLLGKKRCWLRITNLETDRNFSMQFSIKCWSDFSVSIQSNKRFKTSFVNAFKFHSVILKKTELGLLIALKYSSKLKHLNYLIF